MMSITCRLHWLHTVVRVTPVLIVDYRFSYLLKEDPPANCIPCNYLLTVEHILIIIVIICQNFYTALIHAIGLTNEF